MDGSGAAASRFGRHEGVPISKYPNRLTPDAIDRETQYGSVHRSGSVRNFMFGVSDPNSENRPPGSFSSAF